jgi:hypothetical protein
MKSGSIEGDDNKIKDMEMTTMKKGLGNAFERAYMIKSRSLAQQFLWNIGAS